MPWKERSVGKVSEEIAACLAKGNASSATRLAFRLLSDTTNQIGKLAAALRPKHQ